jgi:hypothetical protein
MAYQVTEYDPFDHLASRGVYFQLLLEVGPAVQAKVHASPRDDDHLEVPRKYHRWSLGVTSPEFLSVGLEGQPRNKAAWQVAWISTEVWALDGFVPWPRPVLPQLA